MVLNIPEPSLQRNLDGLDMRLNRRFGVINDTVTVLRCTIIYRFLIKNGTYANCSFERDTVTIDPDR